jgi:hypothetical protein
MQLEVCAIVTIQLCSGEKHICTMEVTEKGKQCTYSFAKAVHIFAHWEFCPLFCFISSPLGSSGRLYVRQSKVSYCLKNRLYKPSCSTLFSYPSRYWIAKLLYHLECPLLSFWNGNYLFTLELMFVRKKWECHNNGVVFFCWKQ